MFKLNHLPWKTMVQIHVNTSNTCEVSGLVKCQVNILHQTAVYCNGSSIKPPDVVIQSSHDTFTYAVLYLAWTISNCVNGTLLVNIYIYIYHESVHWNYFWSIGKSTENP